MELFLELLRLGCFSYKDVVKLAGNKKTADSFLRVDADGLLPQINL